MDVKFLNPFVQAAVEVLKTEVGANAVRGEVSLHKSSLTSDDITVLINLIGDVYGVVMYGMSTVTCLNMVSKIMGQEFTEFNTLAQSGVAELGNVISGQATIRFSESGYKSNISTPTVLNGNGVEISTLDFPRIVVPLETQFGMLTVHLALREKKNGEAHLVESFISSIKAPVPQSDSQVPPAATG
ncbi:MAG TPA: chemotaxis protein CheX [Anaerolineales bacterium]|nr:chemotaxis protein CheX [Anaerolineales bacterium]